PTPSQARRAKGERPRLRPSRPPTERKPTALVAAWGSLTIGASPGGSHDGSFSPRLGSYVLRAPHRPSRRRDPGGWRNSRAPRRRCRRYRRSRERGPLREAAPRDRRERRQRDRRRRPGRQARRRRGTILVPGAALRSPARSPDRRVRRLLPLEQRPHPRRQRRRLARRHRELLSRRRRLVVREPQEGDAREGPPLESAPPREDARRERGQLSP